MNGGKTSAPLYLWKWEEFILLPPLSKWSQSQFGSSVLRVWLLLFRGSSSPSDFLFIFCLYKHLYICSNFLPEPSGFDRCLSLFLGLLLKEGILWIGGNSFWWQSAISWAVRESLPPLQSIAISSIHSNPHLLDGKLSLLVHCAFGVAMFPKEAFMLITDVICRQQGYVIWDFCVMAWKKYKIRFFSVCAIHS